MMNLFSWWKALIIDSLVLHCDISFSFFFFWGVINLNNWSASYKKSMPTLWLFTRLPQLWLSFPFQSHQSESRSFMEPLTGKLPNVIWSFSHESGEQIDRQVKQSWVCEWCFPCLQSAQCASARRIYPLLWPTTCYHTTLEWSLSCELSFLTD